jgi:hypothetical protein
MTAQTGANAPPRLPFVVSVGVTGHRSEALPTVLAGLRSRIRAALQLIADGAEEARKRDADCFSEAPTRLLLISPLADGADQIVAEEALALGYALHAVLPFERIAYRGDLADDAARAQFDLLLGRAEKVLELPGLRDRELEAYAMIGRATISHCDILLGVWDGLEPRGRGGTAEVVRLAIRRGTPVLHLPVDDAAPAQLLWSAFDPAVITEAEDETVTRPVDAAQLDQMLGALLLPPQDPQEQRFLRRFCSERARRIQARIEYPLLLAVAGVSRFKPGSIRESRAVAAIEQEWRRYREQCVGPQGIEPPLDLLETAYSWSDRLATHLAQTYRSGHVFNFVLGGFAVCMGLSSFMLPHALLELALAEFVITLAIILNTKIGLRNEWHRRWLDYRQLAERLRPMRSLKLLALAAPDAPGTVANPVPRRWIDWYAAGVWRAMGCPSGSIDPARASDMAKAVGAFEIAPQVAYHERNSRQIETLDRRLEGIASMLFLATLVACVAVVAGQAFAPGWVAQYNDWLTLVSAGFPALGTAVFGIRFQGDFGGTAVRSQGTANALRQIRDELAKGVPLGRASDLTEQAARVMLSDLDEWRLINQQQDLDIA